MKATSIFLPSCAALATFVATALARQMHANIDYARYLAEADAVADELDAWMSKYKEDAKANGWLPQAESRDADEVTEDHKQRFFMSKQLVEDLKKQNPDANFSTDSPFSLMTTDEFSTYIKNSYIGGGGRQLRSEPLSGRTILATSSGSGNARAHAYSFGELMSKYWGNSDSTTTTNSANGDSIVESFSFQDLINWINNNYQPNSQPASQPDNQPETPTDAPATSNPLPVAPTNDEESSDSATPAPASNESGEIGADGSSIDWSTDKCMPPVQNQGQCGSCWSFATIAGTETGKCIASKASSYVKLSEQNLATCDTRNYGCNGGATSYGFQYIQQNGVCSESDVPYTMGNGVTGTCTTGCTKIASGIKSTSRVQGESGLVSALNTHPVVIAVAAGNAAWKQYRSGIISSCQTTQIDHAVLAVGYDATTFKIRNSWGANWGEAGYIRMKRTSDSTGVCSMYTDMIHANF